jgi:putative transposase
VAKTTGALSKPVLWLLRNGCRWRALPKEWGNWHTTYTRFRR